MENLVNLSKGTFFPNYFFKKLFINEEMPVPKDFILSKSLIVDSSSQPAWTVGDRNKSLSFENKDQFI